MLDAPLQREQVSVGAEVAGHGGAGAGAGGWKEPQGELFRGIMQWELESGGIKGKLPIFYFDNTSMTAVYSASTRLIRKYLPHPSMHPVEILPGRCLVGFTAFEYRRTDIDPYNEFSISILISYDQKPKLGRTILAELLRRSYTAYVWHLPVTTEIARRAGKDLYGYPKFLADISFRRDTDLLECTLREGGEHILTLRGGTPKTQKGQLIKYKTYAMKDGVPLCANVHVLPSQFAQSMTGGGVSLELGERHPIARELRGIDLSRRPVLYQYSPVNQAILFGPRNLSDE